MRIALEKFVRSVYAGHLAGAFGRSTRIGVLGSALARVEAVLADRSRRSVSQVDPALARLDPGEREAIQLAEQEHADLLLMDEKLGVRVARQQGLAVAGTLGVLVQAARRGLIDVEPALLDLDTRGEFPRASDGRRPVPRRSQL